MSKKKKIGFLIMGIIILIGSIVAMWHYTPIVSRNVSLSVNLISESKEQFKLAYTTGNKIDDKSFAYNKSMIQENNDELCINTTIPSKAKYIKVLCNSEASVKIREVEIRLGNDTKVVPMDNIVNVVAYNNISSCFTDKDGTVFVTFDGADSYLIWNISNVNLDKMIIDNSGSIYKKVHIIGISIIIIIFIMLIIIIKDIIEIPSELISCRHLIWDLAKTDFKSKYAASYFGIFWAFVQPVVTIAIYTFVFQVGFKAGSTSSGYPFLLYLVSGIIPWFFFAESWMNATNSLVDYNYLVKKVVFKIDVLPVVKIVSALFIHLFFIGISLLLYIVDRRIPNITFLQLPYYLLCTICFVLALSYFTAAITPFFQDISMIINIITQIGMWTIPIMYDEAIMGEKIMKILRFNPMYYVVTGYRDAFMHGTWFWNRMSLTIYFWVIVIVLFLIGNKTFKKLKVHFADVL